MGFGAGFFVTFTSFNKAWSNDHLRYGLMSNIVRGAHCDGKFVQYGLADRFKSDYETVCGAVCEQLLQQFGGPIQTAYRVNPMDHTQVIVFATNQTSGIPTTGAGLFPAQVFVSFRGTQAFDVINNRRNFYFKFWPVSLCANCEAHKGFWRNFISLRPEIQVSILEVADGIDAINGLSTEFLTTGMSMGGPLASLAAYHLKKLGHNPMGAITFGSPRVGNLELAAAITGCFTGGVGTTGIAYMRDPVPHVPPRLFGYKSAQKLLFHIAMEPLASVMSEMGESFDLEDYVLYSKAYESTPQNNWEGDKEFAGATYTFKLTDHFGYFLTTVTDDLNSCGMLS